MASRYCHLCGSQLKGSFLTYVVSQQYAQNRLVICSNCNASAAHCRLCGRPMAEQLAQDGICAGCLANLVRCDACRRPVDSGIELQDGSHRVFCHTCTQTLPACFVCQAPTRHRGSRLPDGRFRCRLCDATSTTLPKRRLSMDKC